MAEERSTVDELHAAAVAEARAYAARLRDQAGTVAQAGRLPLARWLGDIAVLHSRVESEGGEICVHLRAGPGAGFCFASRPGLRVCQRCVADGAVDDLLVDVAGCDRCGASG